MASLMRVVLDTNVLLAALLAMSLAGNADYLVTGDRRAALLQRGSIGRTRIVTPATFCAEAYPGVS
jgi:predicted nucleic acid-binding protein